MAEKKEVKKAAPKVVKPSARFFKNKQHAAGTIILDPEAFTGVRFVPYYETWQGDRVKVGYLKIEDPKVAEVVAGKRYVEEIKESEYNEATGQNAQRAPL